MRSHLEFISAAFPALPGEGEIVNPRLHGRRVAAYLARELPRHGFPGSGLNAEDWGWRIDLENRDFPLWIGCGGYAEYENGFLCFIEPSRPSIRRLFKRFPTVKTIERLACAMQAIFEQSGKAERMRWWAEEEIGQ